MREPGGLPLRIVTVNSWKGDGAYLARIEALGDQLRALEPDVVLLQEALIAADGSLTTPDCLARELGMNVATHAMRRKCRVVQEREVDSWSALAVLTRWPIAEVSSHALPSDPEDGDRAVLFAALETPGGLVRVANTHLTHLRGRSELRRAQLAAILAAPFLERPAAMRLLGGDMNATPGTPEIAWLLSNDHDWLALDTYDAADGPEMRATLSDRNPNVTSCGERIIDYVFALAHHEDDLPALSDARVVFDHPSDTGVYPSDHFGVAVSVGG